MTDTTCAGPVTDCAGAIPPVTTVTWRGLRVDPPHPSSATWTDATADLTEDGVEGPPPRAVADALEDAITIWRRPDLASFHGKPVPPNETARDAAILMTRRAWGAGLQPEAVTIDAAGGIVVWYERCAEYLAVECSNDGTLSVVWAGVDGALGGDDGTISDADRLVRSLQCESFRRLWVYNPTRLTASDRVSLAPA